MTDLLANVERAPEHRPPLKRDEGATPPGHWLGCAGGNGHVGHWRRRALAAEAELLALRQAIARWDFKP
jgi:hypothetical protein